MPPKTVKGYLFEYFVRELLKACGFAPVPPDRANLIVYSGPAGMMVQGLGQAHNADVLMSPPMQTPFYYPTRLLVECKCLQKRIGLPVLRGALGLREDINHFDIVTEQYLRNRRSNRTTRPIAHPFPRYQYQVAVASASGFSKTAVTYADAHRIPLISFGESAIFADIFHAMDQLSDALDAGQVRFDSMDEELAEPDPRNTLGWAVSRYLRDSEEDRAGMSDLPGELLERLDGFAWQVQGLVEDFCVGLLENGTLLFLQRCDATVVYRERDNRRYTDGYVLHWSADKRAWQLRDDRVGKVYLFELPQEMLDLWKEFALDWDDPLEQRRAALNLKDRTMARICILSRDEVQMLGISPSFVARARREMESD